MTCVFQLALLCCGCIGDEAQWADALCRYRIETLARANEKLLTKEYLHLQVTVAA
jgi:hypothetical protein